MCPEPTLLSHPVSYMSNHAPMKVSMPYTVQEEIDLFNEGKLRLYELSPDARRMVTANTEEQRLGFTPDFSFRAAGVSMEKRRQAALAEVTKLVTPNETPKMHFEPEPTNAYDRNAIKIIVATARDHFGDYQCFEEVGYVPRGRCPHCGESITGKTFDAKADSCPKCKNKIRDEAGALIDPSTEFNIWLGQLLQEGRVKYAVESVTKAPGKATLGLAVAIKVLT